MIFIVANIPICATYICTTIQKNMITLDNVTIAIIDCLDNRQPALNAIEKTLQVIKPKRFIYFTDVISHDLCESVIIDKIDSKESYSYFVFKQLANFINTEFCMIIQWDGYPVNEKSWTNEFLKYDYIGAAWWYPTNNVGNGGFSIRSLKLMKEIQKSEYRIIHPEDDRICRLYRNKLEELGIVFAPVNIAEKFSYEHNGTHPKYNSAFGFHGNKPCF